MTINRRQVDNISLHGRRHSGQGHWSVWTEAKQTLPDERPAVRRCPRLVPHTLHSPGAGLWSGEPGQALSKKCVRIHKFCMIITFNIEKSKTWIFQAPLESNIVWSKKIPSSEKLFNYTYYTMAHKCNKLNYTSAPAEAKSLCTSSCDSSGLAAASFFRTLM